MVLYILLTPSAQFHGSDMLNIYFGGELTNYLIHFANHLNPNSHEMFSWGKYHTSTRSLLTLWDGLIPITTTRDTYRQHAMNVLTKVSLANPLP
jgi:acetylcholinesterase